MHSFGFDNYKYYQFLNIYTHTRIRTRMHEN